MLIKMQPSRAELRRSIRSCDKALATLPPVADPVVRRYWRNRRRRDARLLKMIIHK